MPYNKEFYAEQSRNSRISAEQIVPFLLKTFPVSSVVDLGCGLGTWLSCFIDSGINDVDGYDGEYIPREVLQIPSDRFHAADLAEDIVFTRRYSLAISLEVAEHIPPEKAEKFISKLTSLSDIVLFSSAFPYQGGTGHLNENYPEYWAILFKKNNFIPLDILRDKFWFDGKVCPWYRQNMLIFINRDLYENDFSHLPSAESIPLTKINTESYLKNSSRAISSHIDAINFESDKSAFYSILDAWRFYDGNMPDRIKSYGKEYNVEYSENDTLQALKTELAENIADLQKSRSKCTELEYLCNDLQKQLQNSVREWGASQQYIKTMLAEKDIIDRELEKNHLEWEKCQKYIAELEAVRDSLCQELEHRKASLWQRIKNKLTAKGGC